jgi:hypothetical protein
MLVPDRSTSKRAALRAGARWLCMFCSARVLLIHEMKDDDHRGRRVVHDDLFVHSSRQLSLRAHLAVAAACTEAGSLSERVNLAVLLAQQCLL